MTQRADAHLDEQAWQQTRRRLHAFVAARLGPPAAVEDVVQEVLVKMVENLDGLTDGTRIQAWAYRIARNSISDEYRRRGRQAGALAAVGPLSTDRVDRSAADEVHAADLVELSGCLRPLVEALDEPYRQAVALTGWQGLTQAQAATRVGVSLPAMKSRVQRGRAQIRGQLLACCAIEAGDEGLRGHPSGGDCACAATGGCGCDDVRPAGTAERAQGVPAAPAAVRR